MGCSQCRISFLLLLLRADVLSPSPSCVSSHTVCASANQMATSTGQQCSPSPNLKEDEELSAVLCSAAVRAGTFTKGRRALKATLRCPMGIRSILMYLFAWCLPPSGAAVSDKQHQVLFIFHGPIQTLGLINNVC